jgi:hypothetical protein
MSTRSPRTEQTTCRRCRRPLRSTTSITAGIGPTCARRDRADRAAEAAQIKAATIAKAHEDIDDGAIIDTRRTTRAGRRIFAVLSSTGTGTYLATTAACTCRAGHAGRVCRHRAAAILTAA